MGDFSMTPVDPFVLATIEVPCPIPDCGSVVYAPSDDNVRIDCLDCGAALLTRRGIGGAVTLDVFDDPEAPSPPLDVGRPVTTRGCVSLIHAFRHGTDSKEESHG